MYGHKITGGCLKFSISIAENFGVLESKGPSNSHCFPHRLCHLGLKRHGIVGMFRKERRPDFFWCSYGLKRLGDAEGHPQRRNTILSDTILALYVVS